MTFAADVYAATKLLHFMLTGRYLLRERLDKAFLPEEIQREPRLQMVLDEVLSRCIIEEPSARIQTGGELLALCQRLLTSFRNPSVNGSSNGGSLRKLYDSFTQAFVGDPRQASLAFDELQDGLRVSWLDQHSRVESKNEDAPLAAEQYVRSQAAPLAASLALARTDAEPLFPHFKRLLESTTKLSEGIAGYSAVATIPQVEAGFLYMATSLFALHHQAWNVLEKLLTAKFEWVYQSARVRHSYGFSLPHFFHSNALEREDRHHDLFRSVLLDPYVVDVTRLEKEQLLDVYAQADLLMSLRASQAELRGESAPRWADFGRFDGERVTPLLDRIHSDADFAAGVLRSFGESGEEFEASLNTRLRFIWEHFFRSHTLYLYSSIREWHPR